jgi:DNA-binding response OmpR family regulator
LRILTVEADSGTADCLAQGLRRHGHDVQIAANGAVALERFRWAHLVLLELELPDIDGLEVCREIWDSSDIHMIIVTSRGSEVDRVLGLQAGSDDYVVKPYSFRELMARIDAVMRRSRHTTVTSLPIECGPLRIDPAAREVRVHDRTVHVTRKEFGLLYLLASESEEVIPRQRIMSEVWDDNWTPSNSRTIDTHINALRKKLGAHDWIVTVRGVGFKMRRFLSGS